MNVAYCLSGFLRNYKNNNFFENMVSQVPGDVFIHTWDELIPGQPLDIKEVIDYYKPTGLMIENQQKFKTINELFYDPEHLQNYHCMWRSISSSIDMASAGYDVIVRFRPDLLVTNKFNKTELEFAINNYNTMFIGASDDCYRAGILTDNFAFGNYWVMKAYSEHYGKCWEWRENYESAERALSAYLIHRINTGIKLKFQCSGLTYNIKRMDNSIVENCQTVFSLSPNWYF